MPSYSDATQMPLICVKVKETVINIDPLFFKWLIYIPESTIEKRHNTSMYVNIRNIAIMKINFLIYCNFFFFL